MPYGNPSSNPELAAYSASFSNSDGATVSLSMAGYPVPGLTESEKDAAFQQAVDALAALGWSYGTGSKSYPVEQEITATP